MCRETDNKRCASCSQGHSKHTTERFTDLIGQAKFPDGAFGIWLKPVFNTAPAASKNDAWLKSGQNRLKNKQLALLI